MKKLVPALALLALSAPSFSQTLEERVESLELSRDLNWIKWGGSLETRYDNVNFKRNKAADDSIPFPGTPFEVVKGSNNNNYMRMWANLNMEAKPNDRMTFFGRLAMAKYMNVFGQVGDPDDTFGSTGEGNVAGSTSAIYLERAFVNYSMSDSWTFTMGRLPTIDGPNKHIALNQQLMGNYPALAYSAILDGFGITKTIDLSGGRTLRAKAIYTPAQAINYTGGVNVPITDANGHKVETLQDGLYSGLVEYEQNKGSFFDKNLTIFQYVKSNTGLITGTTSDLYINVDRFAFYTEFQKLGNTGLDLAFQAMYSDLRSKGSLTTGSFGFFTDNDDDKLYGTATVVTARYQLPINALNRPKIGVEWFNASDEAFVYDLANVNPINMYQSVGSDVYHLFWNQDFGDGLSANLGYYLRKQTRTYEIGGIFGKPQDVDNKDQNVYLSLLATF